MRIRCLHVSCILATTLLSACRPGASVHYVVAVSEQEPREIRVTADIASVPREGLILRGFAGTDLLRISDMEAMDARGARLTVREGADTVR